MLCKIQMCSIQDELMCWSLFCSRPTCDKRQRQTWISGIEGWPFINLLVQKTLMTFFALLTTPMKQAYFATFQNDDDSKATVVGNDAKLRKFLFPLKLRKIDTMISEWTFHVRPGTQLQVYIRWEAHRVWEVREPVKSTTAKSKTFDIQSGPKMAQFFFALTSSKINRFSKLFHYQN